MIQNAIKILTLGFFISMISGFVLYRMGYFEDDKSGHSLHTSPNGGELLIAHIDQDSTRTPQINQQNQEPIMPSSKSAVPIFEVEQGKEQPEILPSSKSMILPIEIQPTPNQVSEKERQDYKIQPEIEQVEVDHVEEEVETEADAKSKMVSNQIDAAEEPEVEVEKAKGISWGPIGLGVLGILFVAIGSIVYFKRKS